MSIEIVTVNSEDRTVLIRMTSGEHVLEQYLEIEDDSDSTQIGVAAHVAYVAFEADLARIVDSPVDPSIVALTGTVIEVV